MVFLSRICSNLQFLRNRAITRVPHCCSGWSSRRQWSHPPLAHSCPAGWRTSWTGPTGSSLSAIWLSQSHCHGHVCGGRPCDHLPLSRLVFEAEQNGEGHSARHRKGSWPQVPFLFWSSYCTFRGHFCSGSGQALCLLQAIIIIGSGGADLWSRPHLRHVSDTSTVQLIYRHHSCGGQRSALKQHSPLAQCLTICT